MDNGVDAAASAAAAAGAALDLDSDADSDVVCFFARAEASAALAGPTVDEKAVNAALEGSTAAAAETADASGAAALSG